MGLDEMMLSSFQRGTVRAERHHCVTTAVMNRYLHWLMDKLSSI